MIVSPARNKGAPQCPAGANAPLPAVLADAEREARGSIALDQWRGMALLLVLVSHGFFFTNRINGVGRVGVNLFFFISGILVFRSLSRTRAATGAERARSFWWRRLRRLYPAVLAYALTILPLVWVFQNRPHLPLNSDFASFLAALPWTLLYATNYVDAPMSIGHLWSLACEMQFYLLAPIIYLLSGNTPKRRLALFGSLLALLMGLGMVQPFIGKWKYHFEFAVWPMMLGFCCESKRDWFRRLPELCVTWILRLSVAIGAIVLCATLFGMEMKSLVIATGALLLAPCLLAYLAGRPVPGGGGRALQWLGERTYSIYLWQQPFTLCNFLPPFLHPLGALLAVPVGGLWFHFFERPFLSTSRRK